MTHKTEQEFLTQLRKKLDASLMEIDDDVLKRLRQARLQAVHIAQKQHTQKISPVLTAIFPQWLAPASSIASFATIAVIAGSLWLNQPALKNLENPLSTEDISILSSKDELEFYQNLDFYLWLAEHESRS